MKLYNRAGVTTTTAGTGTITLGSAIAAGSSINAGGFQTFGTAGAADGQAIPYLIIDVNNAWEYGTGTYTASGTTLSRTLGQSSTGSLLSLSGSAQVFIIARKEDIAKLTDDNTFTGQNTLAVGTTSLAPLTFQSGTNLTSATAGVMEYDGVTPYFTHATSERGFISTAQWIRLSAGYTLANSTSAQKLFNSSTNGAVTVAGSTTYEFECDFDVTGKSTSGGQVKFGIGGTATLTSIRHRSDAGNAAVDVVATTPATLWTASAVSSSPGFFSTVATVSVYTKGIICVNAGGTIIPQVTLATGNAGTIVGINSFFKIWPIGSNTATTLGNWS